MERESDDEQDVTQKAEECAVAVGPAGEERQHEYAEQRTVEDGPDPVNNLDQRPEPHGDVRDDSRDDAPEGHTEPENGR